MNYDHFERQVLGYEEGMGRQLERRRLVRAGRVATPTGHPGGHSVRLRAAAALRSLASRLETRPVSL